MRFGRKIPASVAIDGEDFGHNRAHLRWFIVDDSLRGFGLGKQLLNSALAFADAQGFVQINLWTFSGLCIGGRETRLKMGYRSLGATLHQVPINVNKYLRSLNDSYKRRSYRFHEIGVSTK